MPVQEKPFEELARSYRVLDAPTSASALTIKSNYRKLIKRWHPDKPATNAATSEEAMMMTKVINEAYALIENAPLRYYEGKTEAEFVRETTHSNKKKRSRESLGEAKGALTERRLEYAVRIGCGILSGAFVGVLFGVDLLQNNVAVFASALVCALLFAAGAAKVGDKIWRRILGIWWKWE